MFKKISTVDLILMGLAFITLIYAETAWFLGQKESALFVGLWVPSILAFAIYLKLLKMNNK